MALPKEISSLLTSILLEAMPREAFVPVVRHMAGVVEAIRTGELKIEDIPESTDDLILCVCEVVKDKVLSESKEDEAKVNPEVETKAESGDGLPADLDAMMEKMVSILAHHNIEKAFVIRTSKSAK